MLDLVVKIRRIDADDGGDVGLRENPDSQLGVAPARRENENPEVGAGTVAGDIVQRSPLADNASTCPRNCGAPERIPWKSRIGSPKLSP